MRTLTTEGIILKRINYKDADRILTVYTKDLGKIIVLAKGVRKLTSKKRGDLELFNQTKISLAKGKTWYIVTQTELVNDFNNIKLNNISTSYGFFIAEIFEKLTNEDEINKRLYAFLLKTYEALNCDNENINIVNAFQLKILNMSGFLNISNFEKILSEKQNKYIKYLVSKPFDTILKLDKSRLDNNFLKEVNNYLTKYTEDILDKELKVKIGD